MIEFDKKFWPKTGTKISKQFPHDLTDLWSEFPDQTTVFIAEALIDNEPRVYIHLDDGEPMVEVFLWEVGGDTLSLKVNIANILTEDLLSLRCFSDEQREEVSNHLKALDVLTEAINEMKKCWGKLIADYDKRKKK